MLRAEVGMRVRWMLAPRLETQGRARALHSRRVRKKRIEGNGPG
jgi:hypothetical protein